MSSYRSAASREPVGFCPTGTVYKSLGVTPRAASEAHAAASESGTSPAESTATGTSTAPIERNTSIAAMKVRSSISTTSPRSINMDASISTPDIEPAVMHVRCSAWAGGEWSACTWSSSHWLSVSHAKGAYRCESATSSLESGSSTSSVCAAGALERALLPCLAVRTAWRASGDEGGWTAHTLIPRRGKLAAGGTPPERTSIPSLFISGARACVPA
mmetsp:Transcript_7525/g.23376  ORF Transcript_7525/g.23376 Transcript_7525/m.23376 type:complete len:216 (-) Transcript_7525:175-822(-)